MMAAILNSAMLDLDILHKTLTQSSSIWVILIVIWLNFMMAAILKTDSWISAICTKLWLKLILSDSNLIFGNSILQWLPSWILPSWIQPFCTKLWLKLAQSDSNSFILTQLDDISHFELYHVGFRHCHLGFKHLVIFSQIHSKTLFLNCDPDSN